MNNNDRRVRKRKKALCEAIAKLLLDKDLRSITVKELTDTADVHRATFYSHYQDVYDLYEQIEDSFVKEIDAIIVNDPTHSYEKLYMLIINYVYENAVLYKMFMGGNGNQSFTNRFRKLIEENYLKIWLYEDNKSDISEEMRYFTTYHIQGCISIVTLWVMNDFAYPKESVLALLRKLNDHIDKILP